MTQKKYKANKVISAQRVSEISECLVKGYSRKRIVQKYSEKWQITERQIDTYIKKATKSIIKNVNGKTKFNIALAIRRYNDIYRETSKREKYQVALNATKELTNLLGLLKQKLELDGKINPEIPEMLKKEYAEFLENILKSDK